MVDALLDYLQANKFVMLAHGHGIGAILPKKSPRDFTGELSAFGVGTYSFLDHNSQFVVALAKETLPPEIFAAYPGAFIPPEPIAA